MDIKINLKSKKFLLLFLILLFGFFSFSFCLADTSSQNLNDAFGKPLEDAAKGAGYDQSQKDITSIISIIINLALSFLGVIFLGLMIYGGYYWMTARGEEEKVTKAKDTITRAIVGLVIVVAAYAISVFVVNSIESKTLKNEQQKAQIK